MAIGALDADVVGLVELQNDDGTAVRDLIAGLNARPGALPYTELPTGVIGGDAIKVTFIYRESKVKPVGDFDVLDSSDDPRFIDTRNRPALNQQFEEVLTGERFTASINHFKSKGSDCLLDEPNEQGKNDPDLFDGQGNCNVTRTDAAAALADHLAGLVKAGWDRDVIILGDLNSYRREAPITMLESKGYVNLIEADVGPDGYSYLFDGQIGYLDHALGTSSLAAQVTGVTEWHVNADEVPLFDYNDTILDAPGEASFERESMVGGLDVLSAADERRSSDHDPVLVGLDLASLTVDDAVILQAPRGGGTLAIVGTTRRPTTTCPTLSLKVNGSTVPIGRTRQIGRTTACLALTGAGIVTFDRRTGAFAGVLGLPATFRLSSDDVVFVLAVDATTYGVVPRGQAFRFGVDGVVSERLSEGVSLRTSEAIKYFERANHQARSFGSGVHRRVPDRVAHRRGAPLSEQAAHAGQAEQAAHGSAAAAQDECRPALGAALARDEQAAQAS